MALHHRTHPTYVEGCFGCKAASVRTAAEATPFRKSATVAHGEWARRQFADDDAYRRLRKNGLQPTTTVGAAHLEKHADTPEQVEGKPKLWARREEILAEHTLPERVSA